jgi:hypothetical protein
MDSQEQNKVHHHPIQSPQNLEVSTIPTPKSLLVLNQEVSESKQMPKMLQPGKTQKLMPPP